MPGENGLEFASGKQNSPRVDPHTPNVRGRIPSIEPEPRFVAGDGCERWGTGRQHTSSSWCNLVDVRRSPLSMWSASQFQIRGKSVRGKLCAGSGSDQRLGLTRLDAVRGSR